MDTDIEAYRFGIKKESTDSDNKKEKKEKGKKKGKQNAKECPPPPPRPDKCESKCTGTKSTEKKKKKRKRIKNPTLGQIAESAGDNCCACCRAMMQYLVEVCKLIWCLSGCHVEETRVAKVLCEMIEITCNFGRDCCDLVRYVFRCLSSAN